MKVVKTTILIPDSLMHHLKKLSSQKRCTISSLVEAALRMLMETDKKTKKPKNQIKLPNWNMGKANVDISNREALYNLMES